MMAWPARLALVLFCCAALPTFAQVPGAGQAPEAAQPAPAPTRPLLKPQELEQPVAPIALYPDTQLAQLLTASTALGGRDRAHARNGSGRQAADRGRGDSRGGAGTRRDSVFSNMQFGRATRAHADRGRQSMGGRQF